MPLADIQTHLIAGPLGAGKTTLIQQLFAQRPAHERWAVLVNEYGQVGLDAALLTKGDDQVAIVEVPGGCVCCVQGVPLRVGLTRLLRRARPQRLFIEPSGLGHPALLYRQLQQSPWQGVLALQPLVVVLDARTAFMSELPASQASALADAGLLVLNKSATLDTATRLRLRSTLPDVPVLWTEAGRIELTDLPRAAATASVIPSDLPEERLPALGSLLLPGQPLHFERQEGSYRALGWRWHSSHRFVRERLLAWIESVPRLYRAKAVVHTNDGWLGYNRLEQEGHWQPSAWRRDSRLEIILAAEVDYEELEKALYSTIEAF